MKYRKIIISLICLVCIVTFCFIATTGKIYKLDELPLNFMSAFLGTIVTILISLILLSSQKKAEEIKERNVIIFKEKSAIYKSFINRLNQILQEKKFDTNTYREIKTEFYTKLVLYLKEKSQIEILNYLSNLGECIGISINDGTSDLERVNNSHKIIKENIYNIINVLTEEIGLGGKINISLQNQLDNKFFPNLFKELLLEEIDNIFSKEKIFNKACYQVIANGTFLVLNLNGKLTTGGGIHIGPFFNYTANENFPAYDGIYFRFFLPLLNPVSELYSVNDGTNYNKPLTDFVGSKNGLINLQDQLEPWNLKMIEMIDIDDNIYNQELKIIRFDDIDTIKNYSEVYKEAVKAIATKSYFYFLTAKTKKDNLTIRELYEKFENVPHEQYFEHVIKTLSTSIDFGK